MYYRAMLTTPQDLAKRMLGFVRRCDVEEMLNTQITWQLKRDLADYYQTLDKNADIRYTNTDKGREIKEFLLDFCVIADHRMDTAIESEWNPDLVAVEYDFEKLLYVKASLKVMICDSPDYVTGKLVPAVDFLTKRKQNCETGETYMIFNWRGNRGVANCHTWTPTEKSPAGSEAIRFRCLPGFPAIVSDKGDHHARDAWLGELD